MFNKIIFCEGPPKLTPPPLYVIIFEHKFAARIKVIPHFCPPVLISVPIII